MADRNHSPLTLPEWLRSTRAIKRMARADAAREIGVSASTLARWEVGERWPFRIQHVRTLARWGGASEADVLAMVPR